MNLKKDKYTITKATLEKVLEALDNNRAIQTEDDEDNNYEVIEADRALQKEIKDQEL